MRSMAMMIALRTVTVLVVIASLHLANLSYGQAPAPPTPANEDAADKSKERAEKDGSDRSNDAANGTQGVESAKDNDRKKDAEVFRRQPKSDQDTRLDTERDRNRERHASDHGDTNRSRENVRDRNDSNRSDANRDSTNRAKRAQVDERDYDRDTERQGDRDNRRNRDSEDGDRDRERSDGQSLGLSFSDDESDDGLIVDNLESSGIAARAGIRQGDVIYSVNGQRVHRQNDFQQWVSGRSRTPIGVVVVRDGRRQTVYIQPRATANRTDRYYRTETLDPPRGGSAYLGVTADRRYPNEAIIRYVFPNSAADEADLRPGEVILSVDGVDVESPGHLTELISQYEPGDEVDLEVATTDDRTMTVTAELGRRPVARNNGYSQDRSYYQNEYRTRDGRTFRDDRVQGAQYEEQPRRAPGRSVLRSR